MQTVGNPKLSGVIVVFVPHHAFDNHNTLRTKCLDGYGLWQLAQAKLEDLLATQTVEELEGIFKLAVSRNADGELVVSPDADYDQVGKILAYGDWHAVDIWHAGNEEKLWRLANDFYNAKGFVHDSTWNDFRRSAQRLNMAHFAEHRLLAALAVHARETNKLIGG